MNTWALIYIYIYIYYLGMINNLEMELLGLIIQVLLTLHEYVCTVFLSHQSCTSILVALHTC